MAGYVKLTSIVSSTMTGMPAVCDVCMTLGLRS